MAFGPCLDPQPGRKIQNSRFGAVENPYQTATVLRTNPKKLLMLLVGSRPPRHLVTKMCFCTATGQQDAPMVHTLEKTPKMALFTHKKACFSLFSVEILE